MSLDDLVKSLRNLTSSQVLVGWPSDKEQPHKGVTTGGKNVRRDDAGNKQTETQAINNATLAYIHTNGVPEKNIPARPILGPAIKDQQQQIKKRLYDAGQAALEGDTGRVEKNLNAIGIETVSAARRRVQQGIPPPLAPATVKARQRRTKGSKYKRKASTPSQATPLIDTGQLIAALSYVIHKK